MTRKEFLKLLSTALTLQVTSGVATSESRLALESGPALGAVSKAAAEKANTAQMC